MALDRTWYNTLVDDDGSNTVGTLWNKASVDSLMDAVDAEVLLYPKLPATTAPTTTGTETALAIPSGTGTLVLYLNNATLLNIQGIAAGLSGQLLFLFSKGAGQVDLNHLHASGTALGKLKLFATSGVTSLAAGAGVAVLEYDSTVTQWRLVNHEQGAWITPTFAAGDFTGNAAMTWTLAAGDRTMMRYRLSGRTLQVAFSLNTCTVGGTLNTTLQIGNGQWGGFTAADTGFWVPLAYVNDAGAVATPAMISPLSGTLLGITKQSGANWAAAADINFVRGHITFEVA